MNDQRLFDLTPIEQIRREMQQQERLRELHPDLRDLQTHDRRQLSRIWVAYVWENDCWMLYGFRRKPRAITARAIRRIRRKLKVPKGKTLQLVELWQARRDGPPTASPARYVRSTAPDIVDDDAIALEQAALKRQKRRRYTKAVVTFGFGKAVEYVAFGKPVERGQTKLVYLGPLMATTLSIARREAKEMFSGYYGSHGIVVYHINDFKKGPKRRMRSGALRPGKSRVDLNKILSDDMRIVNVNELKGGTE